MVLQTLWTMLALNPTVLSKYGDLSIVNAEHEETLPNGLPKITVLGLAIELHWFR